MKLNLAGLTRDRCPSACTNERCVISTVGICKHPCKSSDEGCGSTTLANRMEARKALGLHQEKAA